MGPAWGTADVTVSPAGLTDEGFTVETDRTDRFGPRPGKLGGRVVGLHSTC